MYMYEKSVQCHPVYRTDNIEIGYEFQGMTCRGYDPSRVRLGKHLRREGTRRESRILGTSCRGYEFAGVRLVQLPRDMGC